MEMEMKWKWKCGQFKWRDASYCLWPTDLIPQVKSPVLEMPKINATLETHQINFEMRINEGKQAVIDILKKTRVLYLIYLI